MYVFSHSFSFFFDFNFYIFFKTFGNTNRLFIPHYRSVRFNMCLGIAIVKLQGITGRGEIIRDGAEFLHFVGRSVTLIYNAFL